MIRTIIIDDEPLAVEALTLMLQKMCREDVAVVATSNSPHSGRALIEELEPDLVFVDVEMPGMSGIDLVKSFSQPVFHVVFVTAFDIYAIEALRLSATDYLLKPVEVDEIVRVVAKVKGYMQNREKSSAINFGQLEKLLLQPQVSSGIRLGITMADKIVFITIEDICYCEASGAYTCIHLNDGKKLIASKPLGEFEAQLVLHKFFRIHHSTLINLRQVKEFQRYNGGYVIMNNDVKLEVSHRRRKDFLSSLGEFIV